jgi:hypothetical protein
MPFCTKTNAVWRSVNAGAAAHRAASPVAFTLTKTASCGPRSAALSVARTRPATILAFASPSLPTRKVTPRARIASRCGPRATTDTACPAAANLAARCPPIAPAPKTQKRCRFMICTGFYLWCNIETAGFPKEFTLDRIRKMHQTIPALSSLWCRQDGLRLISKIY